MSAKAFEMEQEPEKTLAWNCHRLEFQRMKSGLSRVQLAEIMGVSQKQVMCMEQCTRIPSKELLDTLVSFFDVPADYFGVEAQGGNIDVKPSHVTPQDERQQAAKEHLLKQRHTLRVMMKKAGFPLNCTGLHNLAEAIDEPIPDTCRYVNGELLMPADSVKRAQAWYESLAS